MYLFNTVYQTIPRLYVKQKPVNASNKCITNVFFRCGKNNPCQHICTDTGMSIQCSCRPGYELDTDKKSCKDIDECSSGIHECYPEEKCINLIGDYECEESPYAPEVSCPIGYKFDAENKLCNGKAQRK